MSPKNVRGGLTKRPTAHIEKLTDFGAILAQFESSCTMRLSRNRGIDLTRFKARYLQHATLDHHFHSFDGHACNFVHGVFEDGWRLIWVKFNIVDLSSVFNVDRKGCHYTGI